MDDADRTTSREVYLAYRRELIESRSTTGINVSIAVIVAMNAAFMWLDHHVYPAQFWHFFVARMLLNLALFMIFIWGRTRHPEIAQVAIGACTGVLLLYVIQGAGPTSEYYVGLLLLIFGLPMLLPFSTRQLSGICGVLVSAYIGLPVASSETIEFQPYAINVAFLISAAVISNASCYQLNQSRLIDFIQRDELARARDHLRELDRAKSRFTANVHHELRTPLTLILAPLAALRAGEYGEVPDFIQSTLTTMEVNGRRLHKLINNLLDLAKLESHQFSIERRPVDLKELANDVVSGARPLAQRKGIALAIDGFESVPTINADPDALDKVLVNLVGNALKFTDEGGRISIWAARIDGDGVRLEVRDTGIGISPDELGRVFDRFAQLDGSTTRKHEGTGIGLSLVHELVELHRGRVWAESDGIGRGARICIELPLGEADNEGDVTVISRSDGSAVRLSESIAATEAELNLERESDSRLPSPRTVEMQRSVERWENSTNPSPADEIAPEHPESVAEVLIAEDNPDMRRLLAFLLSREFRVRVAKNGREALEMVRERPPYLVLTDVMMPEMSGTELCSEIKDSEETRHIPVVLVTSKAEREMKIAGLEIGADDYVTKPFHPRELLARVRSLVRVRDLQESLSEQNASLERALDELRMAQGLLIQNERLAAVGELAAGIAHEVNNPVNFALNASRTLKTSIREVRDLLERLGDLDLRDETVYRSQLDELAKIQDSLGADDITNTLTELAEIISNGLTRTSDLVGDLRDFASPPRLEFGRVDVREGIESTLQLIGKSLEERRCFVTVQIPSDLPHVHGDAGSLNQIYLNLLKNAAEASSCGDTTITVGAKIEGDDLCLTFSDDGPGIPTEDLDRLFEPFFTTKPQGEGTGLGLSSSKQIAERHHGSLTVESTPDRGTTFFLRLPLHRRNGSRSPRP